MSYCKISGVGGYVPKSISNDDYIDVFGKKAKQVARFLSHENRYQTINIRNGNSDISNIEMAYEAAKNCLDSAGVPYTDIDLIIYSTATPDYLLPASYTLLQEKLGIPSCAGFDIRSGCAGFGTGLVIASSLIETGLYKNALVVGAENISTRFGTFIKEQSITTRALLNLMMFGDGAGAMLLQNCNDPNKQIYYKMMRSNRSHEPYGSIIEVGGSIAPYGVDGIPKENWPIYQVSGLSEKILPDILIESLREFSQVTNKKFDEIAHFVLPVLDKRMFPIIEKSIPNFPVHKAISIEPVGGALANAAVPLSFLDGVNKGLIKLGDEVVIFAGENTKWQYGIMAGFWNPKKLE